MMTEFIALMILAAGCVAIWGGLDAILRRTP